MSTERCYNLAESVTLAFSFYGILTPNLTATPLDFSRHLHEKYLLT